MKLHQPSCRTCKRIAHHKTGDKTGDRFFCAGKRKTTGVHPSDTYNFCIYTPWKGVIQFQIYEGDINLWMALFYAMKKEMDSTFDIKKMENWLESVSEAFKKEARLR